MAANYYDNRDHIDEAFERYIQESVVWVDNDDDNDNDDGSDCHNYFLNQSWVTLGKGVPVGGSGSSQQQHVVKPNPEEEEKQSRRPLVLHTCLRHEEKDSPKIGLSYAHDRHPFVAFVNLLDQAKPDSDVFMSVPLLSDFDAIDRAVRSHALLAGWYPWGKLLDPSAPE